ncbi:MAG: hypothetical protein RI949_3282 [Pseudomonadota bacterium]|jgi:betaine-aldehyde dehydrogenase
MKHAFLWIDGQWREGAQGRTAEVLSPATGEVVATYADADVQDTDAAIAAARKAFDQGSWARSPRQRAAFLLSYASALEAASEPLAEEISATNGKLMSEARHEIVAAASELRYYAGLARNIFGRVTEIEPGLMSMLAREPLGVAAIIVPWNAPLTLLARSLAPAVAAGCTCVIKSAGQTSLPTETALRIASEIPTLPRGVLNLIAESGSRCGQRIVDSPDVDMVSYTGSTPVGKAIMAAGAATLKRLNLELGGNAPVLVLPTARIATAVEGIVRGALSYAGQVCVAASRIIVHQDIADQVRNALVERLKAHTPGMPKDPGARMGPLINRQSRERILSLQDSGGAGAINRLACSIPSHLPRSGGFITAGLIEVQDPASALMQDEVFGPLLSLTVCNNEREMAAVANRSRFGLAAGLWSEDLGQAQSLARDLRTGTVWINGHMRLFAEIETGGYKESGIGRLHGVEGLDAFLQSKHISWEMVIPAEK